MNNCKLAYTSQSNTTRINTIIINANEEPFPLRLTANATKAYSTIGTTVIGESDDLYDLYTINPRSLGECPRKYFPLEKPEQVVNIRTQAESDLNTLSASEAVSVYTNNANSDDNDNDNLLYRSSYLCCGMCVRVCSVRCPWDVHFRIYMMYHRELAMHNINASSAPSASGAPGAGMSTMLKLLSAPLNYKHALQLVLEDINGRYAVGEAWRAPWGRRYFDTLQGENNHKLDYGERWVIDEKTGRPKTNPESGDVVFIDWPKSGLCQYCITRIGKLGGRY